MGESSGQSEKEVLEALVYSWYLKPPGTSGGRERETEWVTRRRGDY